MKLFEKLVQIRKELPGLLKDKHVKFGSTDYWAVSETAVLKNVKPFFDKYSLILIPEAVTHMEMQGKMTSIAVQYSLVDAETGDAMKVSSVGNGHDAADKGAGKAFTYATKHAYLKLLMLVSAEDPDDISSEEIVSRESSKETKSEQKEKHSTEVKRLLSKIDRLQAANKLQEPEAESIRNKLLAIADDPERVKKAADFITDIESER